MLEKKHTYQPLVILYNDDDYISITDDLTTGNTYGGAPKPVVVVLDKETGKVVYKSTNFLIRTINNLTNSEYVDLGLPSGNLWSSCNLGASEPYEFGKYYQWGAVNGYSDSEDILSHSSWASTPFNGGNDKFSKPSYYHYKPSCYPNGFLNTDYDAVYHYTNGEAHMPTIEDVTELIEETTPIYYKGVVLPNDNVVNRWCLLQLSMGEYVLGRYIRGHLLKDNKRQTLFIPAAGYYKTGIYYSGRCLLWTNESYSDMKNYLFYDKTGKEPSVIVPQNDASVSNKAHCLSFKHDNFYMDNFYKYFAMPIRGIKTASTK